MKKQWVAVGILAGTLVAGDAFAQHKAPNQQPTTAEAPTAPTGEIALGSARLPKAVTADGKPLPAGSYTVRVTAQESKPETVGQTESARALGGIRAWGRSEGTRSRQHHPRCRVEARREGCAAEGGWPGQGPAAARERIRSRVVQQGREPLRDQPRDRVAGNEVISRYSVFGYRVDGAASGRPFFGRYSSTKTLKPPYNMRFTSKGMALSFICAAMRGILHHLLVDAIAMRARFVDDEGKDHRLPRFRAHGLGKRRRPLDLQVVADTLLVIERPVFAPDLPRLARDLAGTPRGSSWEPGNRNPST